MANGYTFKSVYLQAFSYGLLYFQALYIYIYIYIIVLLKICHLAFVKGCVYTIHCIWRLFILSQYYCHHFFNFSLKCMKEEVLSI